MFVTLLLYFTAIVCLYKFVSYKQEKPIFGVYTQKSRWYPLKYVVFLAIYFIRIAFTRHLKLGKWSKSGFGVDNNLKAADLDRPQPLSSHIKAFDAAFFLGANPGGYYFAMGCERRKNNIVNACFYLAVPGKGLMCSPKLPDTVLFNAKENQFGAEGLLMIPVEPMKKWKLRYKGDMRSQSDPDTMHSVKFSAEWTSKYNYFNYDTDLHPFAIARALAKEPWTKEYFEMMKSAHQSRYEQMGEAVIKVEIDGGKYEFTTQSFRDHGFGAKRDWSLMHRYAFFHIFLENGLMAAIGVVSQPCTTTSMETGFVQEPDGRIHPLEWCDFQLHQNGENGIPPKDHGFQFKAGGTLYRIQVQVVYESTHYYGWDWEAKMVERFVKYSVNGINGQGVSEFNYRYRNGRPSYINEYDPLWFQRLRKEYLNCK